MADNITVDTITGNPVVKTDDDGTAHWQYVKVAFGADNTQTRVTSSAGLPTDPLDRAARDCGKVDVASLDQYTAIDVDSGAGSENALPVSIRIAASGGSVAQNYGSGTVSTGTLRVTLATDVALPAGTNGIGKLTANSGVDIGDVDVTSIAAGSNLIGDVGLQPRTSGGVSMSPNLIDIDESEEEVKSSAGQVYGYCFDNLTGSYIYVKFYDATAANTTVGTTTPVTTIPLPPYGAKNMPLPQGIVFSNGICVAATTGIAVSDTGAPAANACAGTVWYK